MSKKLRAVLSGGQTQLYIMVLDVSELKWKGTVHFHSDNYKVFYSENDKIRAIVQDLTEYY